jgi:hypothetical protein
MARSTSNPELPFTPRTNANRLLKMQGNIARLFFGILCVLVATTAYSQNTTEVHARLVLADAKTSYRVGEPIRLLLQFTADRDGYSVETIPDGTEGSQDTISISPDGGVNHWLDEFHSGGRGFRDYFSRTNLTSKPTTVEIFLNDSIRIDRPGRYSLKVTTLRVAPAAPLGEFRPALTLITNEVSFDVVAMSDADEEKEVKRISESIDAARGYQAEEAAARQLAYLTGDPSTREKLRRFLNPENRSGNYGAQIYFGIFIARNRALVLQSLEAAMRDPNVPVTHSLLATATKLRILQESSGSARRAISPTYLDADGDPTFQRIRDAYLTEIAAGLAKRTGKSQTTTATTILTSTPKSEHASSPAVAEARRILIANFDNLHPFDQEYLMRVYWEQLRDPSLVPSLKKMLAATGMASKNIHDAALKRLIEVSSDEAKPFVIAELKDPTSLVDLEVLGSISGKTMPEADAALAEQIRRYAPIRVGFDRVHLRQKTFLAARFATEAIYADLMQVYRDNVATMPLDARAGLLAYFARINEGEAIPLIDKTLDEIDAGMVFNFLPDLTKLYYSDAIDTLVRKQLESDIPQRASDAAYVMSLHGGEKDQAVLEARLGRWRKDWGSRATEADANLQGSIERELVSALVHAKSWKLPPERVKELEQSCVTKMCKQNFPR